MLLRLSLLLIILIPALPSFAHLNFGTSMNSSVMDIPPIVTNLDNEYTFRKNSVSFYAQKSMLKETLFFTGKTELVNIMRDGMIVNGQNIAQQENQGIRSLELSATQYLYTSRGWRYHLQAGYNFKGMQSDNTQLKFAIPSDEVGAGLMLIKAKKPRGVITPILNGMMNITDVTLKKVELNAYAGSSYRFIDASAMMINPISKSISMKLFGKLRRYTLDNDAPMLINEEKFMAGLIFKTPRKHSFEFNIYKDFISQELGSSVGINYFMEQNSSDLEHKMLRYYEKMYVKKKATTKSVDEKKKEIEEMVDELLEERGF